ncbi:hypothetical protein GE118_02395 [Mycoplasma sp. NEAQ87857]|uniref:hypothetical protein n=1 Tax=Mycoplasma sp. NEAQ87857 TaxID=2683967 RepID=UPI0013192128|nr:hypothetical protein [Mycoplasma sp. NEAQ87857]QGZ97644.1 hypothetical protein GE118_02395 [Mycoplasma sp. NEAQ87857]
MNIDLPNTYKLGNISNKGNYSPKLEETFDETSKVLTLTYYVWSKNLHSTNTYTSTIDFSSLTTSSNENENTQPKPEDTTHNEDQTPPVSTIDNNGSNSDDTNESSNPQPLVNGGQPNHSNETGDSNPVVSEPSPVNDAPAEPQPVAETPKEAVLFDVDKNKLKEKLKSKTKDLVTYKAWGDQFETIFGIKSGDIKEDNKIFTLKNEFQGKLKYSGDKKKSKKIIQYYLNANYDQENKKFIITYKLKDSDEEHTFTVDLND